jgi:hypothetical protein
VRGSLASAHAITWTFDTMERPAEVSTFTVPYMPSMLLSSSLLPILLLIGSNVFHDAGLVWAHAVQGDPAHRGDRGELGLASVENYWRCLPTD